MSKCEYLIIMFTITITLMLCLSIIPIPSRLAIAHKVSFFSVCFRLLSIQSLHQPKAYQTMQPDSHKLLWLLLLPSPLT